jgi:hypothetical protein
MTRYFATDIDLAMDRIDGMLRALGVPAQAGACQCSRCARHAPAAVACEPAKPDLPGGDLVVNPHPQPVRPPSDVAIVLPHGIARRAALAAIHDEIQF